jgi:hypothetical protein
MLELGCPKEECIKNTLEKGFGGSCMDAALSPNSFHVRSWLCVWAAFETAWRLHTPWVVIFILPFIAASFYSFTFPHLAFHIFKIHIFHLSMFSLSFSWKGIWNVKAAGFHDFCVRQAHLTRAPHQEVVLYTGILNVVHSLAAWTTWERVRNSHSKWSRRGGWWASPLKTY